MIRFVGIIFVTLVIVGAGWRLYFDDKKDKVSETKEG